MTSLTRRRQNEATWGTLPWEAGILVFIVIQGTTGNLCSSTVTWLNMLSLVVGHLNRAAALERSSMHYSRSLIIQMSDSANTISNPSALYQAIARCTHDPIGFFIPRYQ